MYQAHQAFKDIQQVVALEELHLKVCSLPFVDRQPQIACQLAHVYHELLKWAKSALAMI